MAVLKIIRAAIFMFTSMPIWHKMVEIGIITEVEMKEKEVWKDSPDFDGVYQVSTLGRVRTVDRKVTIMDPTRGGWYTRSRKGKILGIVKNDNGFNYVCLYKEGVKVKRQVQRLVAITFLENPNDYADFDF